MKKSICFAYYVNGQFVGWYADSFGSCRKCPKLYENTDIQIRSVYANFMRKMAAINTSSFSEERDKVTGLAALSLGIYDSEELLRGKRVELRVVECPEYDGPNPNFNRSLYEKACKEMLQKMKESGVLSIPGPSKERSEAVQEFYKENPYPKAEHWIYADYNRVAAWAKNEPKDFIKILTY